MDFINLHTHRQQFAMKLADLSESCKEAEVAFEDISKCLRIKMPTDNILNLFHSYCREQNLPWYDTRDLKWWFFFI